ncbi:hypothetical protein PENARI_c057G08597 [Penicillium arizonense]|jgi:glyoxylase-like metal-dependent hydrolase (beta-lactamase superfamily II)|uniref:Metallo-beta-lactamase domain-containing protein n=1 Tax=Penicillium arizonense TaxID=1835702 RepID=A0A1F5L2I9_PENAI|nr:hypothetical protein PENARI_c057G08597 [Penicillium arizonense]OGE47179.1 hypothetical protein PENARI_c057G08597 [Penicillium arizonense]
MPLNFQVFFSRRDSATRTGPAGHDHLKWVPTSSTLIYGEKKAVLVDSQLTLEASQELADWVVASGKDLVAIFVTHSHGDHFFGSSTILKRFPEAKVIATPEVVSRMTYETSPERMASLWDKLFPGLLPKKFVGAEPLSGDEFELEGEKLQIVKLGHTDTDESNALWVPSIGLVVAGDCVYANTHPYLGESGTEEARIEWIRALNKLAALKPKAVIGGHSDPSKPFDPETIQETKLYLENFNRTAAKYTKAEDIYSQMLELYPERLNPGSAWAGALLAKRE